jgi:hypothetical protein
MVVRLCNRRVDARSSDFSRRFVFPSTYSRGEVLAFLDFDSAAGKW